MPKTRTKKRKLDYSKIQRPTRKVGGKTYTFRSRWEYNVAKWLQMRLENGEIEKWEFEPKAFCLKRSNGQTVGYLPDFRVIGLGETYYIEVKGRMTDEDEEKIELFREQFGRLDLIDETEYQILRWRFGRKLKF